MYRRNDPRWKKKEKRFFELITHQKKNPPQREALCCMSSFVCLSVAIFVVFYVLGFSALSLLVVVVVVSVIIFIICIYVLFFWVGTSCLYIIIYIYSGMVFLLSIAWDLLGMYNRDRQDSLHVSLSLRSTSAHRLERYTYLPLSLKT